MRVVAVLAAVALSCVSCADSVTSPTPTGSLNVFMTDTPFSDARALLVTFSEVTAHRASDGGFTQIPFGAPGTSLLRTCDLKRLEDTQALLGAGPLPEGQYTQLRIVVLAAALYFENPSTGPACGATIPAPAGRRAVAEVASGEVKLIQPFEIVAGTNAV